MIKKHQQDTRRTSPIQARTRVVLASVGCIVAALTLGLASFAANPASGTLSASNPTLTYTGGPH